jgi:hypothetical protein
LARAPALGDEPRGDWGKFDARPVTKIISKYFWGVLLIVPPPLV